MQQTRHYLSTSVYWEWFQWIFRSTGVSGCRRSLFACLCVPMGLSLIQFISRDGRLAFLSPGRDWNFTIKFCPFKVCHWKLSCNSQWVEFIRSKLFGRSYPVKIIRPNLSCQSYHGRSCLVEVIWSQISGITYPVKVIWSKLSGQS